MSRLEGHDELGGVTANTGDANWPRGDSVSFSAILSKLTGLKAVRDHGLGTGWVLVGKWGGNALDITCFVYSNTFIITVVTIICILFCVIKLGE